MKIDPKKYFKKPQRGMHSEIHTIARDISKFCGESKKFGLYLGIVTRIGKQKAFQILSEMKQSRNLETPAKFFMWKTSKKEVTK